MPHEPNALTPPPRHDPYQALRHRNFRWFIASLFAMTLGTQMQAVVVGWQIYELTHDPLSLGLVGLAEVVPYISFALFAGQLADRYDRRRIAIAALFLVLAGSATLLAISVVPGVLTREQVWPVYAAIFFSGLARSFLQPARQALGIELVPRGALDNAVTWRTSTWQAAAVGGPAVGGLLYGFTNIAVVYAAIVGLLIVAVGAFWVIRHAQAPANARHERDTRHNIGAGLRFVFGHPVILGAMTLDLFSVFLGGADILLPVFAAEILHVGPQGLGVLRAAPAAGAILTSLWLAHRRPFEHAGRTMLWAVAAFALCIVGFGLSRTFLLSLLFLTLSGVADNVSVVIRSTLLAKLTPPELYGRVMAVNSIFIGSSNELGAVESGVAARLLGTVPSVVAGGLASLGVVAVIALRVPALRQLRAVK